MVLKRGLAMAIGVGLLSLRYGYRSKWGFSLKIHVLRFTNNHSVTHSKLSIFWGFRNGAEDSQVFGCNS